MTLVICTSSMVLLEWIEMRACNSEEFIGKTEIEDKKEAREECEERTSGIAAIGGIT